MPKPIQFPNFSAPRRMVFSIDNFKGIDRTSAPANVAKNRSCWCPNMIRDTPGKVCKRPGTEKMLQFDAPLNGIFELRGTRVYHAGTELHCGDNVVCDAMADGLSTAKQLGGKLWISDGAKLRVYGKLGEADDAPDACKAVEDIAFVPQVSVGRAPNGGGETYHPVNLLSEKFTDSFNVPTGTKTLQLSFSALLATAVMVQQRGAGGTWTDLVEGTGFSVNRTTGLVTLTVGTPANPVTGEDNVKVTAAKDAAEGRAKINGCRFGICYGVAGAADRLFLSGNGEWSNYTWYSELDDPTYFGDLWYVVTGQAHSATTGFSIINRQMAIHKKEDDNERNIYLYYGSLSDKGEPQFTSSDIIQGKGAISPYSFGYVKEPIFLTRLGICATTPIEYNAERYVQGRSYFLNGDLVNEAGMENATACVFKEFYVLALGGRLYILDTLVRTNENSTRSDYQYEGYIWLDIPARVLFANDTELWYGDAAGGVYRFKTDLEDPETYSDAGGGAIDAWWDFDPALGLFHKNKSIKYFACRLAASTATSCVIDARVKGIWRQVGESGSRLRYWTFSQLCFSKLSFSCDTNPRTIGFKTRIKKVDAVRFRVRNNVYNEPFGLYDIAIEFYERGNFKG